MCGNAGKKSGSFGCARRKRSYGFSVHGKRSWSTAGVVKLNREEELYVCCHPSHHHRSQEMGRGHEETRTGDRRREVPARCEAVVLSAQHGWASGGLCVGNGFDGYAETVPESVRRRRIEGRVFPGQHRVGDGDTGARARAARCSPLMTAIV